MKIRIVGGGPAGLFFAILAKRRDPAAEVTVLERRPRASTFGWGIAFSSDALDTLRAGDPETGAAVAARVTTCETLDIVHRLQKVSFRGRTYHGIARIDLLDALHGRCTDLGVDLRFEERVADPAALAKGCDLLVGADGFHSAVRRAFERAFEPRLSVKRNYHIWYGTKQRFSGVTLTFRAHEAGLFVAHSYPTDRSTSTVIVDCHADTWRDAGFATRSDGEARALLGKVFRDDLGGHPLLSRSPRGGEAPPGRGAAAADGAGPASWIHFTQVKNRRWTHGNAVLLGDAAHTTHFSAGAGTRLALDDALALARALEAARDVRAGLAAFEAARKPTLDAMQAFSERNRLSFEGAKDLLHLDPLEFAATLLSSGDPAVRAEARSTASVSDLRRAKARRRKPS